jgi:peptide/nickel transport system ATP-binding protein
VGLVGESGSGKSTTSEMIVRLQDPTSGSIVFDGQDIAATPSARFMRHPMRRDIQMVFQDATDSLNPRDSAGSAIAEPLRRIAGLRGEALHERVAELAALTGLPQTLLAGFRTSFPAGKRPAWASRGRSRWSQSC